jgi:ketosteroid isomerase-like protein
MRDKLRGRGDTRQVASNAELAKRAVGNLQALFELFDPDIVWDNRDYSPIDQRGRIRGRQAVIDAVKAWVGTWNEYAFRADEVLAAGDYVVVVVSESGLGKGSGAPMEHHYCLVWTFAGGRIVRGAGYPGKAEALSAIGEDARGPRPGTG